MRVRQPYVGGAIAGRERVETGWARSDTLNTSVALIPSHEAAAHRSVLSAARGRD
jgi:hypothetical protein